ncbi:MAG: SoxR reducing system RseC family protein [Bacteroidales bacterium]|nr:SoxR reducing system RseC family protein [Bacteroidales bacterium]
MISSDDIVHEGRVISVDSQFTTVEITAESACSSCHARGLCGVSESKSKIIEIPTVCIGLEPGQTVNVYLKRSMGLKAVWLAYVVPLIVLIAVLLTLMATGLGELASGLGGIAAVAMYYAVIWLFRNRLRNEYSFYIDKK